MDPWVIMYYPWFIHVFSIEMDNMTDHVSARVFSSLRQSHIINTIRIARFHGSCVLAMLWTPGLNMPIHGWNGIAPWQQFDWQHVPFVCYFKMWPLEVNKIDMKSSRIFGVY